ncbi:MAG: EAL domain-containing protein [Oscillibacter sp.]|jgi:diguanylate cyclase (GGDEF)-like protein/PAS domain S-box-containing protein|nr:EAL domain-containing protein [Oscillibacter sp.]
MKKTVLIVDDNAINRKILKNLLKDQYELLEAENGKVALDILTRENVQLSAVLLDIIMPVMDGFAVLNAMGQVPELSSIPVLVTSQIDRKETEIKVLEAGARDFVSRPYEPQVLKKRLANLIELHESSSALVSVERDSLTGLYTKEAFYRHVTQELKQRPDQAFSLLAMDIERFKLVNDSFGIAEGDQLLQFLGSKLQKSIRTVSSIASRFHGDSFYALIPGEIPAEEFNRAVSSSEKRLSNYPLNMQISMKFGVYQVEPGDDTPITLMCDRARLAADTAKGLYRSCCTYYDDSIRRRLLREQEITNVMNEALRAGQFEIYFQPKYDLRSECLAGAESLVRWNHPELGFLSPGEFIPLFERNGFITELDRYVWDQTCEEIAQWVKSYQKYVPVSVNVSRKDIYQDDLPQTMLAIVKKHGLHPSQLHLEITETAYTENPEQLIRVVGELKRLGFIIEMDDFGSGYSSLNMLSELPIDILKLDIRFIQKETARENKRSILSFIISLAKWMNLLVVAEGVETQEQINILRDLECTYVQGYYYAKPMPEQDFLKLLIESMLTNTTSINRNRAEHYIEASTKSDAKTMLIVDDSRTSRAMLAETFRDAYTIVEVENGQAAFAYVEQHFDEIAIIMLDLIIPVMDGYELLQKLRANPLYVPIPVIVTSQPSDEAEKRVFSLGASDYLPKPYQPEIAVHRVQNVTARSTLQTLLQEKQILAKMQQLEEEARTDSLTGIHNRAEMERCVEDFFSDDPIKNAVFFMLDIDDFKQINDLYGHDCGDTAIQTVAAKLKVLFRDQDTICRMGGDEFAVFMKADFNAEQLSHRLERMREKLHFQIEQTAVSCSIGACLVPKYGTSFETVYHNADVALLTAKRLGKNRTQIYGDEIVLPENVLYRNMDWLLDESSDAIVVCDTKTYEIYYLNDVACTLAGKDKAECLGRPCYEAIWGNASPCSHCTHMEKMSREYCEHEFQETNTDRTFLLKGKLIDWGSKMARIEYVQDSTDRNKLYREMQALSDDQRMLLRLLPGGMIRYNGKTQEFTFVSENTLRMLGYSREEFSLKFENRFDKMIWREDRDHVLAEVKQLSKKSDYGSCEYRIERRDGTLCWVHDMGYRQTAASGTEFYVVFTDITALKNAELKNQHLAQELKTIVNNMPGALCLYRWNGEELDTLQYSPQFLKMVNRDNDTLLNNTKKLSIDRIYEPDIPMVRQMMSGAMRRCEPVDCVFRVYKGAEKKNYIWLRMQVVPEQQEDGTVLLYALYTDETELQELRINESK